MFTTFHFLVKISSNQVLNFVNTCLIHPNLWLFIWYGLSVYLAANWNLFELHFILSEGACFVWEYEFDLPELLYKVGVSAQRPIFFFSLEIHGLVERDQTPLPQLEHLNDDVERDRDHMWVSDPVGEEVNDPLTSNWDV